MLTNAPTLLLPPPPLLTLIHALTSLLSPLVCPHQHSYCFCPLIYLYTLTLLLCLCLPSTYPQQRTPFTILPTCLSSPTFTALSPFILRLPSYCSSIYSSSLTHSLCYVPTLTPLLPQQNHSRLQPAPTAPPPTSPASSVPQTPACRPREEGTVSTPTRPAPSHAPPSESLQHIPSSPCLVLSYTCPIPARLYQT